MRTILPHIDDFRPVHNIASLMDIAAALSAPAETGARRGLGLTRTSRHGGCLSRTPRVFRPVRGREIRAEH